MLKTRCVKCENIFYKHEINSDTICPICGVKQVSKSEIKMVKISRPDRSGWKQIDDDWDEIIKRILIEEING